MEITSHATTAELLNESLPVADFAGQLIEKFVRKVGHHKALVLQDTEPEPLHKMRVGLRRLRTVLQVLEPLIILPDTFTSKAIGKLANVLGAVRDLDVMGEFLREVEQGIPDREQRILSKVANSLTRRRHQAFDRLEKNLAKDYRVLVRAGQKWVCQPQYRYPAVATQPMADVLPDLLLPIISSFFLHGGWWVTATDFSDNQAILHDLRKCTKRARYQIECFSPCLNTEFTELLLPLEASQECLGHMQDAAVLRDFIEQEVGGKVSKKMPVLIDRLEQKKEQAWQEWQSIRGQLCDRDWRQSLRKAVL